MSDRLSLQSLLDPRIPRFLNGGVCQSTPSTKPIDPLDKGILCPTAYQFCYMAKATQQYKPAVFALYDKGTPVRRIPELLPISFGTAIRFKSEWNRTPIAIDLIVERSQRQSAA